LSWWFIWSPTEELTYNGYALPRLDALTDRPWLSMVLVSFFWALHHVFFPLLLDWHYVIWRFLIFVPVCVILPILFRRFRRLRPLIFLHWLMDFSAVVWTLQF
jgi:membrane protease YdiL (CAAX protease family)